MQHGLSKGLFKRLGNVSASVAASTQRGEMNLHGVELREMKASMVTPESPTQQVLHLVRKVERLVCQENKRYHVGGIVKVTTT